MKFIATRSLNKLYASSIAIETSRKSARQRRRCQHKGGISSLKNRSPVAVKLDGVRSKIRPFNPTPFWIGIVGGMILLLINACQTSKIALYSEQPSKEPPVSLASGDVIKITFSGNPEYNQTQKIRSDGKISLPLVGEIEAAGKKIGPFESELSHSYEKQLQNSEVIVTLETGASQVYVGGSVHHPGKMMIDGPMTALEAIMEAGGFIQGLSNPKKIHLIRIENGHYTTQLLDLSMALKGQPTHAIYLKPKDVIYIPENLF